MHDLLEELFAVLNVEDFEASVLLGAEDAVVVELHDEEGYVGYLDLGECLEGSQVEAVEVLVLAAHIQPLVKN